VTTNRRNNPYFTTMPLLLATSVLYKKRISLGMLQMAEALAPVFTASHSRQRNPALETSRPRGR
jgi:hypothetical protein